MATLQDYLFVPAAANVGRWVRFVNNATGTPYVSAAATDSNGLYQINSIPIGIYTVYTGNSATGPWTATGDNNFVVDNASASTLGLYNVKDSPYNAKGDGTTNDTAGINQAIADAIANPGIVYFPPGTYIVSTLTYGGGLITLRGSGMRASVLKQASGTADFVVKNSGGTYPFYNLVFEDLGFDGSVNTSNIGGLRLTGTTVAIVRRCWMSNLRVECIRVVGGGAETTGDVNNITIEQCDFENMLGTGPSHIHLVVTGSNAKPDDIRIINNRFSTAYSAASIGILSDSAPAGHQAVGSPLVMGNSMEEIKFPIDANWQNALVTGNFFEVTGAGETITIHLRNLASWTNQNNTFESNTYAVGGVVGNDIFTDDGTFPTTARYGESRSVSYLAEDEVKRKFRAAQFGGAGPAPTLGALQAGVASQSLINATGAGGRLKITTAAINPPAAQSLLAIIVWPAGFPTAVHMIATATDSGIWVFTSAVGASQGGIATGPALGINQDVYVDFWVFQ